VFDWFKKKSTFNQPLLVDMHSHLLPGIDDGAKTIEESEELIRSFSALGYKKLITTPHVMSDAYRNTPEIIFQKLGDVRSMLKEKNIQVELEAAAEYYLDEAFFEMVTKDQPLLTFGKNYLLFETNFLTEPFQLKEFIFKAITKGYKVILAHPERYLYLQTNFSKIEDLLSRGVLLQLNMSSISGYYSKEAQRTAFKLIDRGWVHWLGSDCHNINHLKLLNETIPSRYFQKALSLPLLNNSLQ
jgi:protein-tyrosine phosphatase